MLFYTLHAFCIGILYLYTISPFVFRILYALSPFRLHFSTRFLPEFPAKTCVHMRLSADPPLNEPIFGDPLSIITSRKKPCALSESQDLC